MIWQALAIDPIGVGAYVFGGVLLLALAAVAVPSDWWGWLADRRRCRDSIRDTRCVLPSGHDGDHRAAHGSTWQRIPPA